jgi:galactokinase
MQCWRLFVRREAVARLYRDKFGGEPELWARAPGRVDLMGSHTDYNLGFVLTLPISRDTWFAARARDDSRVRLYSANLAAEACFDVQSLGRRGERVEWSDYVRGVAWALAGAGYPLRGFDAVIHSTVPIGSGLSSSAALECAAAVVFRELGEWRLEPERMAQLCLKAENEYIGLNCGILDQFSSCLGREGCALLLDCRDLSTRRVQVAEGIRVMICDTKAHRELVGGEYDLRRARCEEGAAALGLTALRDATIQMLEGTAGRLSNEVVKRCRFIIEENARVPAMAGALADGDRNAIRRLCAESFAGARDLYEICSRPMLAMMESMARAPGIIGARQAGAGFGGCMVAFVEAGSEDAFAAAVSATYPKAEVYPVEPAAGAGLMDAA